MGKKFKFPEQAIFTIHATDTVDYTIPTTVNYKVVIYADSIGCMDCKLDLYKWKEFIAYIDSLSNNSISFLFFLQPKERIEMEYLLKGYDFNLPICIDMNNQLSKLNHLHVDSIPQVFLLNRENQVILTGNPISNQEIHNSFLKVIRDHYCPVKVDK